LRQLPTMSQHQTWGAVCDMRVFKPPGKRVPLGGRGTKGETRPPPRRLTCPPSEGLLMARARRGWRRGGPPPFLVHLLEGQTDGGDLEPVPEEGLEYLVDPGPRGTPCLVWCLAHVPIEAHRMLESRMGRTNGHVTEVQGGRVGRKNRAMAWVMMVGIPFSGLLWIVRLTARSVSACGHAMDTGHEEKKNTYDLIDRSVVRRIQTRPAGTIHCAQGRAVE